MKKRLKAVRETGRVLVRRQAHSAFHTCDVVFEKTFSDPAVAALDAARTPIIAQDGEDALLEHVFNIIGFGDRWCVEFGAWDGKHLSNTWHLIDRHGFRAVLIEGDAERAARLPESYRQPDDHVYLNRFVGWGADDGLDALLAGTPIGKQFDLLSVDIDGNDWHVLNALSNYQPRVVVVEYNPSIPNSVRFVQAPGAHISQGASLRALRDMMQTKGYQLFFATTTNGLFIRTDEFAKLGIRDNSLASLNPSNPHVLQVFELFDGNVVATGREQLVWRKHQTVKGALRWAISRPMYEKMGDEVKS